MDDLRHRLDDLKAAARPRWRPSKPAASAGPARLEDILGGGEAGSAGQRYWLIETPFEDVGVTGTLGPSGEQARRPRSSPKPARATPQVTLTIDPARAVVLDIETGGFSGMPVFLIGVVLLDRRPRTVRQLLARDYPEEEAILHGLAELLATRDTWITFNGRSFDEPFLRDRATLHRVSLPLAALHVDLLHAARRAWRDELPNFRLATVEQHILGRTRVGDVPSSDVPELFHHFMRTGNARPLRPVLEHNRIDLLSCTELLAHLGHAGA